MTELTIDKAGSKGGGDLGGDRSPRGWVGSGTLVDTLGRFGLPVLLVVVAVAFSLLRPESYGQWSNFRAIFDQQSIVALVALAVMVPLIVGEFDLSAAANAGLANILVVGFCQKQGIDWPLAFALAIAASTVIGIANGLIVGLLKVNSFIATLGMSTMIIGIGLLYTGEVDITGAPEGLTNFGRGSVGPISTATVYALVIALVVLLVCQFLPAGRKMTAVGANRDAARLTGLSINRYVIGCFAASGLIAGFAGAMFGAKLGGAVAGGSGSAFLLPAFAAAFLGSTAFTPGRYNVLGTIVEVLFLALLVSGLQIVGVKPWIQPIVNGGALIVAVALSAWASRLRIANLKREQLVALRRKEEEAAAGAGAGVSLGG